MPLKDRISVFRHLLLNDEFEKIRNKRTETTPKLPVRLPFVKTAREELLDKKKAIEKDPDALREGRVMRIKFPEKHRPTTVGEGYPPRGLIYANMAIARGQDKREVLKRTESGQVLTYRPLRTKIPQPIPDKVFEEYCKRMGIGAQEGYEETNEEDADDADGLDLHAFDLYWEDIRIEADTVLRELRHLPLKANVQLSHLTHFERSLHHLSRSCFYSPGYTHKKCEDVIHIYLWLLTRRNLPLVFHIKVLQCLSLIVYSSPFFKQELVNCGGINVLVKTMQLGMVYCGLKASWSAYCLTSAAIGSPEVIAALKKVRDIDERVGEVSFDMFWNNWPTNFGMILQSLMYGPGGVSNTMDHFEFL